MRALEASGRPGSRQPRAGQRPRSQSNVYSACPRRAPEAAAGEPLGCGARAQRRGAGGAPARLPLRPALTPLRPAGPGEAPPSEPGPPAPSARQQVSPPRGDPQPRPRPARPFPLFRGVAATLVGSQAFLNGINGCWMRVLGVRDGQPAFAPRAVPWGRLDLGEVLRGGTLPGFTSIRGRTSCQPLRLAELVRPFPGSQGGPRGRSGRDAHKIQFCGEETDEARCGLRELQRP